MSIWTMFVLLLINLTSLEICNWKKRKHLKCKFTSSLDKVPIACLLGKYSDWTRGWGGQGETSGKGQ